MKGLFAICLTLGFAALVTAPEVYADKPDFSICDGTSGAAWGLCRAGVAAGCADDSGNSRACREIEEEYTNVTGEVPPWNAPPPATCPCDFSLVPKTNPPWSPSPSDPVRFTCPTASDGGRDVFITDFDSAWPNQTEVAYFIESAGFGFHVCETRVDGAIVESEFWMTEAEQAACEADAIDYGQALKAALGTDVDDACTPTLP